MRKLFLALFCLTATPIFAADQSEAADTVFPQKLTAGGLQVYCASSAMSTTGRSRQRYCEGFLSGIEEGARVLGLASKGKEQSVLCVPAETSARQMRAAVVISSSWISN